MGNKGSNTTTTSTAPNPQAGALYGNILSQAQQIASTPYQPYGGELVAPVNQQQATGISGINQYAESAQPYLQTAAGLATNAAQPISAQDIASYENPYTQQVVNSTEQQFQNTNAQQQQQVLGNAAAQGALGGDRDAVAQAVLAGQQQASEAPVIAGLENTGYNTATQTALAEQQAEAQGAYGVGSTGTAIENAGLTGAGAQVGAGTVQQQTQQAQDTAAYQQFEQALAYPFQTEQWLAGIGTGVGSNMGGTSSTTGANPNALAQDLGLGIAGAGTLGSMFASTAGGTSAAAGIGAALAALKTGGAVHPQTKPESHETLSAQQEQLIKGHRRVQMFPRGTAELKLPDGMRRLETEHGVFHFNPAKIGASDIRRASDKGHEHKLLDLGPHSKSAVMDRTKRGEHPVAIVERTPDGTEVRAAAGTWHTLDSQVRAMEQKKSPGNKIHIEDPRHTIAHRRAFGGRIQGFDIGGVVDQPYNAGTGGPYTAGVGYIPTTQITRGQGAPKPPQVQTPTQMFQNAAGLASSFGSKNQGLATGPIGTAPAAFSPIAPVGQAPSSPDAIYKHGGVVARHRHIPIRGGLGMSSFLPRARGGFADGGAPYDQDYFDQSFGTSPRVLVPPRGLSAPQADIVSNPQAMAAYSARATQDSPQASLALSAPNFGAAAAYGQSNPYTSSPPPQSAPPSTADNDELPPQIAPQAGVGASPMSYAQGSPTGGLSAPENITPQESSPQSAPAKASSYPSPDFWTSLTAAGLGMLASRSPFLGNAIGEGGLKGLSTYNELQQQHLAQSDKQQDLDLKVKQLNQQAKAEQDRIAQETKAETFKEGPEFSLNKQKVDIDQQNAERQLNAPKVLTPGQQLVDPHTGAVIGTNDSGAMTDAAVNLVVDRIHAGDPSALQNLGRGAQTGVNLTRIQNRLAERAAQEGWSGADLAASRANFTSQASAAAVAAKREANVESSVEEAKNTFPLAEKASAALPRTDWVPLNKLEQLVQAGTSDPRYITYNTALQGAMTAYSQAMSRTGTNSVYAQQAAHELLEKATSHEGILAALNQMRQEMDAAQVAPETVRQAILSRISGRGAAAPTTMPAAGGATTAPSTVPPAAQRQAGQTYATPKGQLKWTGTGWVTP